MSARDLFGVIVRATGFGLVVLSLFDFTGAVQRVMGLPGHSNYTMEFILTAGAGYFILGLAILLAANFIIRLSYGRPSP